MDAWGFLSDGFITSKEIEIVKEIHTLEDVEISIKDYIIDIEIDDIVIEVQ